MLLIIINFLYTQLLFQLLYKKKYKKIKQNYISYINTNKFRLKNKEWFLNNIPFWYHLLKKNKLLKKQAAGKKKMKQLGRLEIPDSVFMEILKQ